MPEMLGTPMASSSKKAMPPQATKFWQEYKALGTVAMEYDTSSWTKEELHGVVDRLETMMACAKMLRDWAPAAHAHVDGGDASADASSSEATAHLFRVAEAGDLAQVKSLLAQGADVHAVDSNGYGALHLAVKRGHAQVVEVLVRGGANVKAETFGGHTPLHLASKYQHSSLVSRLEVLVSKAPATTRRPRNTSTGEDGNAAEDAEEDTDPRSLEEREEALRGAAKDGDLPAVGILLRLGAGVNSADQVRQGCCATQPAALPYCNAAALQCCGPPPAQLTAWPSFYSLRISRAEWERLASLCSLQGRARRSGCSSCSWRQPHGCEYRSHEPAAPCGNEGPTERDGQATDRREGRGGCNGCCGECTRG